MFKVSKKGIPNHRVGAVLGIAGWLQSGRKQKRKQGLLL